LKSLETSIVSQKKVAAIVTARMSSSRLPNKALVSIDSKPAIEQIVRRVRASSIINDTIVAMSNLRADDILAQFCIAHSISIFRGSEDDLLGRILSAAEFYKADIIVYIAGDCTAIDPCLIDELVSYFIANKLDFASNCEKVTYPLGMNIHVFSTKALVKVDKMTQNPWDREHVIDPLYQNPDIFKSGFVEAPPELTRPTYRLCVDLPADVELMSKLFNALDKKDYIFNTSDIIKYLDQNPNIAQINQNLKHKKFFSIIVGLGQAGMGYDLEKKDGRIRSHILPYLKNPRFKLDGACEPSEKKRALFKSTYFIPDVFDNLDSLLNQKKPEVATVATNPECHAEVILKLLDCPTIKAIICEKPLVTNLKDLYKITDLCIDKNIYLLENYWMRFSPLFRGLKNLLDQNLFGKPLSCIYTYSKGLFNSGSHAVNYLLYLFGTPLWVQAGVANPIENGENNVDGIICFKSGVAAHLTCCDYTKHFTTDLSLYLENASIRVEQNGYKVSFCKAQPQEHFPQFCELILQDEVPFDCDIGQPLLNMYKELVGFLDSEVKNLAQSVQDSILTLEVVMALDKSARDNGARIYLDRFIASR